MNTIRTKKDYKLAIARIEELIMSNPKKGSLAFDELDVLGTLVAAYEDIHFPIEAPNVVEAVKLAMEERNMKTKDLVPFFGSKGVVSEFLNKKRGLSLKTIKSLHTVLGLPYAVLLA
jgi:HTH-type transcriptional regulator / antitoxin HigA